MGLKAPAWHDWFVIRVGAVLFVFPTIAFVDIVDRKRLFYLGLGGMGTMLVLLGLAFQQGGRRTGAPGFWSSFWSMGKPWTFWIHAIFAALAIVFVWRFVPETEGRPLEYIDRYGAEGRHWPESDAA